MHITIEFVSHACMYMNLPMRVRSIITFTVLIQMLMIACIERCGVIWRHGDRPRQKKTEMSQYLLESTKTGDFNPRRTLSVSFFVIPERLASIRSVVLAF